MRTRGTLGDLHVKAFSSAPAVVSSAFQTSPSQLCTAAACRPGARRPRRAARGCSGSGQEGLRHPKGCGAGGCGALRRVCQTETPRWAERCGGGRRARSCAGSWGDGEQMVQGRGGSVPSSCAKITLCDDEPVLRPDPTSTQPAPCPSPTGTALPGASSPLPERCLCSSHGGPGLSRGGPSCGGKRWHRTNLSDTDLG